MANLKKIFVGNPLGNLEMWEAVDAYNDLQDDEQLANFYHAQLDAFEERPFGESAIYGMINYSTGVDDFQVQIDNLLAYEIRN